MSSRLQQFRPLNGLLNLKLYIWLFPTYGFQYLNAFM